MIKTDLFSIMLDAYRNYGINVLSLWDIEDEMDKIDLGFRRKMASNFDYRPLAGQLEQTLAPGIVYMYEDDLHLHYSFFRMTEELSKELHCRLLTLGPFLFQPFSPEAFDALMEEKSIDPIYHQDYLEFFNRIPLTYSMDSWNHMLGFYLERLQGEAPEFRNLNCMEEYQASFNTAGLDYSVPSQPNIALKTIASRYALENKFMNAVAAGNAAEGYRAYRQFQQYRILPRVADPVRNQKNLMFTFNTLLRKAAEMGHVHPMHIDALSRQIAIQIESCLSLKQLDS